MQTISGSLVEMHNLCADLEGRLADATAQGDDRYAKALSDSLNVQLTAYNAARSAFGLSPIASSAPATSTHEGPVQ